VPLVPAICTQCGAEITLDNSHDTFLCEYCHTTLIVEKALQKYDYIVNNFTVNSGIDTDSLVRRAEIELQFGFWQKARNNADQALYRDPENSEAYLIMLLANRKCKSRYDLLSQETELAKDIHYERALYFASPDDKSFLENANKTIRDRIFKEIEQIDQEISETENSKDDKESQIAKEKRYLEQNQKDIEEIQNSSKQLSDSLPFYIQAICLFAIGLIIYCFCKNYLTLITFLISLIITISLLCTAKKSSDELFYAFFSTSNPSTNKSMQIQQIQQEKIVPLENKIRMLEEEFSDLSDRLLQLQKQRNYKQSLLYMNQ